MTGYVFDWVENSEKILNGEGYTTYKHQFMEQVMFCRYLIGKGYNKDEVFALWRESSPMSVVAFEEDQDEIAFIFERVWKAALLQTIQTFPEIVVYQEEIDYINNMEVFMWVKQYIFTMLCVYKYYNSQWCKYDAKLRAFLFSVTSQRRERPELGEHINKCVLQYSPYVISMIGATLSYKMSFVRNSGQEVGRIKNPRYVEELLGLLKCEKKCINCGKIFHYSSQTVKNTICSACYKKQRHKEQHEYHKKQKSTSKRQLIIYEKQNKG